MASSWGKHIVSFILFVQVLLLTKDASAQDFQGPFRPGRQFIGAYLADRFPRPQNPRPLLPPVVPPPRPPAPPRPPGPPYADEDLVCIFGDDLEVPYPLYKQISDSFLSSTNILVLCPNNTIVQVHGYAGLEDIAHDDPDNTKVLISAETMVPAAIYLRIVLIQPEEIMLRLPDGQILPRQIYLERYGKSPETHFHGGQTFYDSVPPEDAFPFLVTNDKKSESLFETPSPSRIPNFSPLTYSAEDDLLDQVTDLSEPWVNSEPERGPQYPLSNSVSRLPESSPVPYQSIPNAVPQRPESNFGPPRLLDLGPPPFNFEQMRMQNQRRPRSLSFPFYPDHQHQRASRHNYPWPSHSVHVAKPVNLERPTSDQKAILPAGIHVIETSRCSICDPSSAGGEHVTVFSV